MIHEIGLYQCPSGSGGGGVSLPDVNAFFNIGFLLEVGCLAG